MKSIGSGSATPHASADTTSNHGILHHLRDMAARHAEELLAEMPATLRRLRTLILVITIAVPVFLAALVFVLWRLAS